MDQIRIWSTPDLKNKRQIRQDLFQKYVENIPSDEKFLNLLDIFKFNKRLIVLN